MVVAYCARTIGRIMISSTTLYSMAKGKTNTDAHGVCRLLGLEVPSADGSVHVTAHHPAGSGGG